MEDFIKRPEVKGRVVFLKRLRHDAGAGTGSRGSICGSTLLGVRGRPAGPAAWKVLVNGGLNLSELDGWWAEAYSPEVGWAIGDGQEHGDDSDWDAKEADTLYTLLEAEVIPEFYERDASGVPSRWLGRISRSMARLTPEFSATRAIRRIHRESIILPRIALSRSCSG